MDGSLGRQARIVTEYIDLIRKKLDVPVKKWDERLTTKQAEDVLIKANVSRKKRKEVIDSLAATLILQSYLETKK